MQIVGESAAAIVSTYPKTAYGRGGSNREVNGLENHIIKVCHGLIHISLQG